MCFRLTPLMIALVFIYDTHKFCPSFNTVMFIKSRISDNHKQKILLMESSRNYQNRLMGDTKDPQRCIALGTEPEEGTFDLQTFELTHVYFRLMLKRAKDTIILLRAWAS